MSKKPVTVAEHIAARIPMTLEEVRSELLGAAYLDFLEHGKIVIYGGLLMNIMHHLGMPECYD